jgi:hypothetical protein
MKINESPGHLAALFIAPVESPDEDVEMMRVLINLLLKADKKPAHWLEIAIRAGSLQDIVREGEDLDYLTAMQQLARMQTEDASEREMHRNTALEALLRIPEEQRSTELYAWLRQNLAAAG